MYSASLGDMIRLLPCDLSNQDLSCRKNLFSCGDKGYCASLYNCINMFAFICINFFGTILKLCKIS